MGNQTFAGAYLSWNLQKLEEQIGLDTERRPQKQADFVAEGRHCTELLQGTEGSPVEAARLRRCLILSVELGFAALLGDCLKITMEGTVLLVSMAVTLESLH